MSVFINFLLKNANLVSVLSNVCQHFACHVWQDWRVSWTHDYLKPASKHSTEWWVLLDNNHFQSNWYRRKPLWTWCGVLFCTWHRHLFQLLVIISMIELGGKNTVNLMEQLPSWNCKLNSKCSHCLNNLINWSISR